MSEPPEECSASADEGPGPDPGRDPPGGHGPLPPAPAEIVELVRSCRQYVRRAVGIEPDLTPETLPVLDHYAGLVRQGAERRPELLPLLARAIGAYFGEVLRRELAFFWSLPSSDVHTWRLCASSVLLAINPVGVAYDALCASTDHDGPSSELRVAREERAIVDRRLLSLPPVSEAEYFMLATRVEVLEIVVEALSAQMAAAGTADVEFDESDYADGP